MKKRQHTTSEVSFDDPCEHGSVGPRFFSEHLRRISVVGTRSEAERLRAPYSETFPALTHSMGAGGVLERVHF
jgi:hypothetical protein